MDMFGGLTKATKSACDVSELLIHARPGLHEGSNQGTHSLWPKVPRAFHV